jgi:rubredoxin
MATRRRGQPAPDDVRCPNCAAITWRRIGERIVEKRSPLGVELRHETVPDNRPWDWTCEQCGYAVRPTGRLDNALSRAQIPA